MLDLTTLLIIRICHHGFLCLSGWFLKRVLKRLKGANSGDWEDTGGKKESARNTMARLLLLPLLLLLMDSGDCE